MRTEYREALLDALVSSSIDDVLQEICIIVNEETGRRNWRGGVMFDRDEQNYADRLYDFCREQR